jgi:hypothetical protein
VVPFTEVNSLGGTYDLADEETVQEQPAAQSANPAPASAAAPVVDTSKEIEI